MFEELDFEWRMEAVKMGLFYEYAVMETVGNATATYLTWLDIFVELACVLCCMTFGHDRIAAELDYAYCERCMEIV